MLITKVGIQSTVQKLGTIRVRHLAPKVALQALTLPYIREVLSRIKYTQSSPPCHKVFRPLQKFSL